MLLLITVLVRLIFYQRTRFTKNAVIDSGAISSADYFKVSTFLRGFHLAAARLIAIPCKKK